MNELLLQAFLRVLVNDQAFLYASLQALLYEKEYGFKPDADMFEKWQDEYKDESANMVEALMEQLALDAFEDMSVEDLEEE